MNCEDVHVPVLAILRINVQATLHFVHLVVKVTFSILLLGIGIRHFLERHATTLQMDAALNGQMEVIKYLVERGTDVNEKDKDGNTLLGMACTGGHLDVVEYLIKMGANVNDKAGDGMSPLGIACLLYTSPSPRD